MTEHFSDATKKIDCISREAEIQFFNDWVDDLDKQINDSVNCPHLRSDYKVCKTQLLDCIHAIKEMPAADVRPVVRKPVVGYEGLYFVSNDGEVTNADGLAIKQYIKKGRGTCYKSVSLYKDGTYKTKYVHRLVAEAFIPNQNNLPIINHKDEDGTNNKVENLEWCTHRYNVNYGTARERQRKKLVGVPHTEEHKKKISNSLYQHYDEGFEGRRVVCLETGVIYDSVAKAARDLGISEAAVRMSCNRGSKKGYKYTFRDASQEYNFCPNCGADMREPNLDTTKGDNHD